MIKYVRHLEAFITLCLLIAFDQVTKIWARVSFADGDSLTIIPNVLKFIYHENTGAVWGIMSNQTTLLTIFTAFAILLMLWFYIKLPYTKRYRPMYLMLLFIAAGAIGNFIDRVVFGFVTDFIYFELIDFPVFNVADCYITVSVIFLAILGIFYYKEEDFDCFSLKRKSSTKEQE